MKKFFQSLPTATIVLLIFALISFVWGSDQKRMAGVDGNLEIVEVNKDSNINNLEGNAVIISDVPKLTETPVDTQFGVKADGYVLVRTVEMYQYVLSDDTVYKKFSDLQNSDIKGKYSESYVNPSFPDDLKNEVFFGKMVVGDNEVQVSEEYIEALRLKKFTVSDNVELKDIENLEIKGYKSCGDGYYTKANPDDWKIGDIRIKFSYLPADALNKVTVCGMMKNGEITAEDSQIAYVSDSVDNIEDIITEIRGEHGSSANVLFVVGYIEIGIGIVIFIVKKIKNKTA